MTIRWDPDSLVLIQRGGNYGRMIRLRDSRLMCVYSHGRQVHFRMSGDEGRTWAPGVTVTRYEHGAATNAEALQLANGTIVVAFNGRPSGGKHPFSIQCVRSTDNGATWEPARTIFEGGVEFENGCWEPALVQLPDGELQVVFANETPYTQSHEQEISAVRSRDGGQTWGDADKIIFRPGHRDGMPVPLLLDDGRTLVVAIEDNGLNGRMKPALTRTSVPDTWSNAPVVGNSPDRWDPLDKPLPRPVYAGAPYICRVPVGHTVLSFQYRSKHTEPDDWSTTYAAACVGDAAARHFGELTHPFAAFGNPQSIWNSVFAKAAKTVTLVSSARLEGVGGLWAIDGVVVSVADE